MPSNSEQEQGITIAGVPVLIDYQLELQDWIDRYLCLDDVFKTSSPGLGEQRAELRNILRLPYPPLPQLKIGQVVWPTGMSRPARALFAVDWMSLRSIAQGAWGFQFSPEDPRPTDAPSDWKDEMAPVKLRLPLQNASGETTNVELDFFVLKPIRVSHADIDAWLLPLVDDRAMFASRVWSYSQSRSEDIATWEDLFYEISSTLGVELSMQDGQDENDPAKLSVPDKSILNAGLPLAVLADAAALSIGRRIVKAYSGEFLAKQAYDEAEEQEYLDLLDQRNTDNQVYSVIAGGMSGQCNGPGRIECLGRRTDDLYLGNHRWHEYLATANAARADAQMPRVNCLFNVHFKNGSANNDSKTAFEHYADGLSAWSTKWNKEIYQFSFAGIHDVVQCGSDDFVSWDTFGAKVISLVKSLPENFLPLCSIAQEENDDSIPENVTWVELYENLDPGQEADAYLKGKISTELAKIVISAPSSLSTQIPQGTKIPVYYSDGWKPIITSAVGGGGSSSGGAWCVFQRTPLDQFVVLAQVGGKTTTGAVIEPFYLGDYHMPVNGTGLAVWGGQGNSGDWSIVEVRQKTIRAKAVLGPGESQSQSSMQRTDASWPVVNIVPLYPFPFDMGLAPFQALNPYGLQGAAGDPVLLCYDRTVETWFIEEVFSPYPTAFRFELTDDMPETYDGGFIIPRSITFGDRGPLTPSNLQVPLFDPYLHCILGKIGDEGIAVRVDDAYHVIGFKKRATRILATVAEDFDETDTSFDVEDAEGLDGEPPPETLINVENVHEWNGKAESLVRCEWNHTQGRWEAYQIDCAEELPTSGGGGGGNNPGEPL